MPGVPSIAESVPGYDVAGGFGFGAPNGTPDEVIGTINKAVNEGLADAKLKGRILDLGGVPQILTPIEYRKLIADTIDKLGGAIKFAGIKAS
jgi:tripartite-type tricarboxylate transporter receptor subunit TctC